VDIREGVGEETTGGTVRGDVDEDTDYGEGLVWFGFLIEMISCFCDGFLLLSSGLCRDSPRLRSTSVHAFH